MIILGNKYERADRLPSLDMLRFQMQYIHSIIYHQKPVKEQDIVPILINRINIILATWLKFQECLHLPKIFWNLQLYMIHHNMKI